MKGLDPTTSPAASCYDDDLDCCPRVLHTAGAGAGSDCSPLVRPDLDCSLGSGYTPDLGYILDSGSNLDLGCNPDLRRENRHCCFSVPMKGLDPTTSPAASCYDDDLGHSRVENSGHWPEVSNSLTARYSSDGGQICPGAENFDLPSCSWTWLGIDSHLFGHLSESR